MKRILSFLLALALSLSLCACAAPGEKADDGKLQIVTTLFPYYDFARAIAQDRADVTLLLSPGREAHSFEPTPLDAVTISEADVFLYNGGEGEYWVEGMLDAAGEHIAVASRMMDYVDALNEEYVEGMQGADGHDHDHEHGSHDDHDHDHEEDEHDSDEIEYDEHIWTSPKNAVVLCRAVCDAVCRADAGNAEFYRANCENYCAQLEDLDARFAALCESAPRRLLIFADRFPMLYFCREYGLDYRAAFHGCSGDTEPSLATIKFLIDKVEDEDIPVVYTIDFGTKKVAAVVSECTGAAIETLYSMQTVSRADFDATYNYNYIYDTALTDGKPGHAIDEGFELIQKWNNYFGLFKSCYFKNREYNMTIDLKEDINYIHIDSQKAERYISIRFYSISESEHRYLYAMSSALDFDAENFIYAVPLIPNNIKGGIGIFSIANQVKYKLKEENCQDRY